MKKLKLILWGNCQADYLAEALRASPDLTARFEISYYTNFSTPGVFDYASCPVEELSGCDVLLYHKVFTPEFVEAAAERLSCLPPHCLRIPLPYLKSNLYWPFFNTVVTYLGVSPERHAGILPYRSCILDGWLRQGMADDDIVEAFTALDPAEHLNLRLLERETYDRWKSLEAGSEGKLKFASFLMENWRLGMQFYLYNHVAKPILLHLANQILAHLDAPALHLKDIAKCRGGQDVVYPVHPGAARFYGIRFAKESTRYNVGGRNRSFQEFIRLYLATARAESAAKQAS